MFSFKLEIDRKQFENDRARLLAEDGLKLVGDGGQVSHGTIFGQVTISYSFNEPTSELTISILKKPMLEGNGTIESHIREWFNHVVKDATPEEKEPISISGRLANFIPKR